MAVSQPTRYQRALRPVRPESLPQYIDAELQKLSVFTTQLTAYIQDLEDRLAAQVELNEDLESRLADMEGESEEEAPEAPTP